MRVLYSFPHKIGGGRIQTTAWEQVSGLIHAGCEVIVCPGSVQVPFPTRPEVHTTLSLGKARLPYKIMGTYRTYALHDAIVAARLKSFKVDLIHCWPLGAKQTLKAAKRLGIPTVLERPNAHTEFAYAAVQQECKMLGMSMPERHEHTFNQKVLEKEIAEYRLADWLLCPSDFVAKTFLDRGYTNLKRHQYGYNESEFFPGPQPQERFTMLFAGGCAPRKGLHYAVKAWLDSPASQTGEFLVAGGFIPGYAEVIPGLKHSSIKILGHRDDIPALMRKSDILVLPSIEEGSALVTSEARGSGCVPVVSEASGAICKHGENGLVHRVGDVRTLTAHITELYERPARLKELRSNSLRTVNEATWTSAGFRLMDVYREVITESGLERYYASCPTAAVTVSEVSGKRSGGRFYS